ncbi:hypothetical protein OUZ56_017613 [Daphnia magna]|uniref:Uncharacterized protein n=1 Tax=Daphnia magna TaxID=35525 RepID=A0ABR0ATQ4_9CRUS|nr:hypothetical protein OUZ56_017613 [Daphnia magna]
MNSCHWSSHRNLCEKLACNEVELWFQSCIMGIESLTIELDNPVGIYFPGEEVSGVVHISNVSSKILKGRETFELVSGVHQFPFVFVLPKKFPLHFKLRC